MELLIEIIKNKPIDSNCFVIYNNSSSDCIIVDPGTKDCSDLLLFLNQKKIVPEYISYFLEFFNRYNNNLNLNRTTKNGCKKGKCNQL